MSSEVTALQRIEQHEGPTGIAHNLFGTPDPQLAVTVITEYADVLKDVLVKKGLLSKISGKQYVNVEGWTLLGSMLGVFPVCEWTREMRGKDGELIGWEARVVATTRAGEIVGAAEAQCTRLEKTWASRDGYALRSMAQTRATSKALRVPLGFIVVLAGYEATPEEEMPTIVSGPSPEGTKDASGAPLTTYSETSPETVPSRSEPPAKVGSSSPSSRSVSVEAPVGEGGIALSSGAEPCAKFVTSTGDTWGACERCGLAIEAHR